MTTTILNTKAYWSALKFQTGTLPRPQYPLLNANEFNLLHTSSRKVFEAFSSARKTLQLHSHTVHNNLTPTNSLFTFRLRTKLWYLLSVRRFGVLRPTAHSSKFKLPTTPFTNYAPVYFSLTNTLTHSSKFPIQGVYFPTYNRDLRADSRWESRHYTLKAAGKTKSVGKKTLIRILRTLLSHTSTILQSYPTDEEDSQLTWGNFITPNVKGLKPKFSTTKPRIYLKRSFSWFRDRPYLFLNKWPSFETRLNWILHSTLFKTFLGYKNVVRRYARKLQTRKVDWVLSNANKRYVSTSGKFMRRVLRNRLHLNKLTTLVDKQPFTLTGALAYHKTWPNLRVKLKSTLVKLPLLPKKAAAFTPTYSSTVVTDTSHSVELFGGDQYSQFLVQFNRVYGLTSSYLNPTIHQDQRIVPTLLQTKLKTLFDRFVYKSWKTSYRPFVEKNLYRYLLRQGYSHQTLSLLQISVDPTSRIGNKLSNRYFIKRASRKPLHIGAGLRVPTITNFLYTLALRLGSNRRRFRRRTFKLRGRLRNSLSYGLLIRSHELHNSLSQVTKTSTSLGIIYAENKLPLYARNTAYKNGKQGATEPGKKKTIKWFAKPGESPVTDDILTEKPNTYFLSQWFTGNRLKAFTWVNRCTSTAKSYSKTRAQMVSSPRHGAVIYYPLLKHVTNPVTLYKHTVYNKTKSIFTKKLHLMSSHSVSFVLKPYAFIYITHLARYAVPHFPLFKYRRYLHSFLYLNDIKRYILQRHRTNVRTFTNIKPSNSGRLKSFKRYVNSYRRMVWSNFVRPTSGHFFQTTENKNLVQGRQGLRIKRVRFKPGYYRIWRNVRAALKESLNLTFRYQHRLTSYLPRWYKLSRAQTLYALEMRLGSILIYTNLVPDFEFGKYFVDNSLVYVNGYTTRWMNGVVVLNDLIQIVVSLKFYIANRWLSCWKTKKHLRLKKLSNAKYNNQSRSRLDKQVSNLLPKWIYQHKYKYYDVPSYMEVDYFTLSAFMIYDPFLLTDFNPTTAREFRASIYKNYNWKYIT